jgi:hypothetical protein
MVWVNTQHIIPAFQIERNGVGKFSHQIFELQQRLVFQAGTGQETVDRAQINNVPVGHPIFFAQQIRSRAKLRLLLYLPHCPVP